MREGTVRRFALLVICVAVCAAGNTSLLAAGPSGGITVDTAFRAGILFGRQMVRPTEPAAFPNSQFRTEISPRLPLVSGMFELSPIRLLSARAAGSSSFLETDMNLQQARGDALAASTWNVSPSFRSYEAALLLHLHSAGAYRFSVVGGYRQEDWAYPGAPGGTQPAGSELRDEYSSGIPFVGLQTSMFFPWWKARFEILGSWFANKKLYTAINDGNNISYTGYLNEGGLVDVQMDGSGQLTSLLRMGLFARYSYQGLNGLVSGPSQTAGAVASKYRMFMDESFAVLGLNFNVAF
jgi:hypothetical protein